MKKLVAFMLILLLLLPAAALAQPTGDDFPLKKGDTGIYVVQMQQRMMDLGYIHFRPTGRYGDMTYAGVALFQQQHGLSLDGMIGEETYYSIFGTDVKRAPINDKIVRVYGPGMTQTPAEYGTMADWTEKIQNLFPVGARAAVTDLNTGTTFAVERTGGINHADVQTVDEEAQAGFLKAFGGDYSWEKRAVLVELDGAKYAASMFGMPNSNDVLKNGQMPGSVCLYFWGSKSDIGAGAPDAEHNSMIARAAGQ